MFCCCALMLQSGSGFTKLNESTRTHCLWPNQLTSCTKEWEKKKNKSVGNTQNDKAGKTEQSTTGPSNLACVTSLWVMSRQQLCTSGFVSLNSEGEWLHAEFFFLFLFLSCNVFGSRCSIPDVHCDERKRSRGEFWRSPSQRAHVKSGRHCLLVCFLVAAVLAPHLASVFETDHIESCPSDKSAEHYRPQSYSAGAWMSWESAVKVRSAEGEETPERN